ncbi:MAG: NAD(P)H:quinone oxidoreductase [Candidatus Yonathbacteria bacterium]|nr:NAD(P)H:quinone oxidoreductase [Candidatus Yonathbacteria bacterium]
MKKTKILVLFYSLSGGTAELAREVARGVAEVADTEVEIKRVPELLSPEFFEKNPAMKEMKEKLEKEFVEATIEDLIEADGVAFGTPVHFGSFASQIKQFIDQLSHVWMQGKMVNKPASVFCSSGSLHGGEEVTLISLIVPLLNLGMIPIGIPYPVQGGGLEFDAGSPYGAIFVNRMNSQKGMSENDKKAAKILGRRLATMTHLMNHACEGTSACYELTQKED